MGNNPSASLTGGGTFSAKGKNPPSIRPMFEQLIASVEEANEAVVSISGFGDQKSKSFRQTLLPPMQLPPALPKESAPAAADTARAINLHRRRTMDEKRGGPGGANSTVAGRDATKFRTATAGSAPAAATVHQREADVGADIAVPPTAASRVAEDMKKPDGERKSIPTVFRWPTSTQVEKSKQVT
jgi:hypothetical protein